MPFKVFSSESASTLSSFSSLLSASRFSACCFAYDFPASAAAFSSASMRVFSENSRSAASFWFFNSMFSFLRLSSSDLNLPIFSLSSGRSKKLATAKTAAAAARMTAAGTMLITPKTAEAAAKTTAAAISGTFTALRILSVFSASDSLSAISRSDFAIASSMRSLSALSDSASLSSALIFSGVSPLSAVSAVSIISLSRLISLPFSASRLSALSNLPIQKLTFFTKLSSAH